MSFARKYTCIGQRFSEERQTEEMCFSVNPVKGASPGKGI